MILRIVRIGPNQVVHQIGVSANGRLAYAEPDVSRWENLTGSTTGIPEIDVSEVGTNADNPQHGTVFHG